MKRFLLLTLLLTGSLGMINAQMIITGAFDGPLPGGIPKGVEIYITQDIADLSIYGIGSANNGQGTDGIEYTLPAGSATMGDFLYITSDSMAFIEFFDFSTPYHGEALNVNGDDALELFMNDNVIDVFGDIDTDGSGTAWEYLDGWAYRNDGIVANAGVFNAGAFTYSGINMYDGATTNATSTNPFPLGTYSPDGDTGVNLADDMITMGATELSININSIYANDFIPGIPTDAYFVSNPTNGILSVVGQDLTYTKNSEDFCGEDSFLYAVCVGMDCDTAMVDITIECPLNYPMMTIAEVSPVDADGNVIADGVNCQLTGVVYGVNLHASGLAFTIIDDNNNGIGLFNGSGDLGYTVTEGDEISIQGTIGQYNGLTQIYPAEISLISQNNALVTPMTVSSAMTDDIESSLIKLEGIVIESYAAAVGGGDNYSITYGGIPTTMRIDNEVEGYGTEITATIASITGICSQFDSSAPYTEGYQIFPRYMDDIELLDNVENLATTWGLNVVPSLFNDFVNVTSDTDLNNVRIINLFGQVMYQESTFNGNLNINTEDYAPGIYIIMAEKDGQVGAVKVMKH